MKLTDFLFFMFYCLTKEDGTGERHIRASYLLETASTFLLSFLTFIVFGLLNIRPQNFIVWILVIIINAIFSYLITKRYYIYSGRFEKILELGKAYNKRRRTTYAIASLFIILILFVILFLGGILMSYLYTLHV